MLTKSLAGTGRDYVVLQIRERAEDEVWHVQGRGENVNREYGVAEDIPFAFHGSEDRPKLARAGKSMYAGSSARYSPAFAVLNDGTVHIQIPDGPVNREYGAVLDIPAKKVPDLAKFIQLELDKGETLKVKVVETTFKKELLAIAAKLHNLAEQM